MKRPDPHTLPPKPRSRWRRRLGRLLFLLAALALFEITLQVYYYLSNGDLLFRRVALDIFRPDELRGWAVKPGLSYRHTTNEFSAHYITNAEGFRVASADRDYPVPKPPGVYRIMLLGPSFAFGWANDYPRTYAALLEQLLGQGLAGEGRVELLNAGVPAMPPANLLRWYKQRGRKFQPDLIVQLMYGSMTASPGPSRRRYRVSPQGYLLRANPSPAKRFREVAKRFATVFYGYLAYQAIIRSGASGEGARVEGAGRELKVITRFTPGDPALADTWAFYRDLREAARSSGAGALVVHFPLSYVIHRQDQGRWRHQGVHAIEQQRRFNADACRHLRQRLGLDCLDLTPALQQAARAAPGVRLYHFLDIHWTPAGNRVAAEASARHLLQRLSSAGPPPG